ncbi:MAG: ribosome maturation factor RimM [Zoogloeaceae bacterium]|nr:ribosome maturation factor RimM [Rhodocyclaceae bacterium]MCP5235084.1 ribosome maturation factor RimM [Zoogloeaceae bacterium]
MIVLGRIVAPFGVQGWLRIHPFGDDPLGWRRMAQWWLSADDRAPDEQWQALDLRACRMHGKSLIAAFDGIDDRNAAERLSGRFVGAPRAALPIPADDEYYWADLIGLEVRNTADCRLGTVAGLIETGAHDVLQVQDGDRERLIPFVEAYVIEVDVSGGRITADWEADW